MVNFVLHPGTKFVGRASIITTTVVGGSCYSKGYSPSERTEVTVNKSPSASNSPIFYWNFFRKFGNRVPHCIKTSSCPFEDSRLGSSMSTGSQMQSQIQE